MGTAIAIVGGLLGLGGIVTGIVWYVRRNISNEVSLSQRNAALKIEQDRIALMEAAAVKERAQRQSELDAKLSKVTDSKSAADLMRDEFNGAGKP